MKVFYKFCLTVAFYSTFTNASQINCPSNNSSKASSTTDNIQGVKILQPKAPQISDPAFDSSDVFMAEDTTVAQVDAHFILLAKHPKYAGKDFILLERREHLWELPHVKAIAEELKTDAGLLDSVARASFRMVPVDPQRVVKFDVTTDFGNTMSKTQIKEMVFAVMSGREVNLLLLEHELNRLNALNPDVRELRWIEFNPTKFASGKNIVEAQCLNITDVIGPCALALNNFSISVLSDMSLQANIKLFLSDQTISDAVVSLKVTREVAEPNVTPLHFMIASKRGKNIALSGIEGRNFWYFVRQDASHTFPLVPDVNSSMDYPVKVQEYFQLEYKTNGNRYMEFSNLHKDVQTGQYYMLIGHVHNAEFKATTTAICSKWINSVSVSCFSHSDSFFFPLLNEKDVSERACLQIDQQRCSPLLRNFTALHRVHLPNGLHTAGIILIRTINNKRYSLLIAGDNERDGWSFPRAANILPEDYDTNHDPFLVGALRNLEKVTFGAIKLDIDQVEKECATISKCNSHGNIDRYRLCHVDSSAFSSGEILKMTHTKTDSFKLPGNVRWVCLDEIMEAAVKTWNPALQFLVNAETLRDDDSCTYRSNYLLHEGDIMLLRHKDFHISIGSAIKKSNSFNTAFIGDTSEESAKKGDISVYAGVLMLDSGTRKIGFAKDGKTAIPYIPSQLVKKDLFPHVVASLGAEKFSASHSLMHNYFTHPILNYDTVIGNTGVSMKLVLFDISIITIASPEKIEWIELDKIFTHPNLSTEDKTIFADASCQESLKYWIDFYASQRPKEMQNN